jgi:hypothetical protein
MDFTNFAKELGIDQLPEDRQERIMKTVFETLQMRVSLRIAQELNDEQRVHLEEVGKTGDPEAIMNALQQMYPNFEKVYQEEIEGLKNDTLELRSHYKK